MHGGQGPHRALEAVLDEIEAAPGGVVGRLTAHGVDRVDLTRLSSRLLSTVYSPAATA